MINIIDKAKCCGCGCCETICAKNAITMQMDNEGFLYPFVNNDLCVNCGKCDSYCPINNIYNINKDSKLAYAMKNKDDAIRNNSSSGGVFYQLAKRIIDDKGTVYGVVSNEKNIYHTKAESIEELFSMLGSKYVQTKASAVFKDIKNDLKDNKKILFSGTPCQVSALNNYIGTENENLYTIAVACHGVPSYYTYSDYVKFLENENKKTIKKIDFRNKKTGWRSYSINVTFLDGSIYNSKFTDDPYMKLFINNITLRPSCYNCKFRGYNCNSDIILGDFWGIEDKTFDDNKGVSLAIVNTSKGNRLMQEIANEYEYYDMEYSNAIKSNYALVKSPILTAKRKKYFEKREELPFDIISKKFSNQSLIKRILIFVYNGLFKLIKR